MTGGQVVPPVSTNGEGLAAGLLIESRRSFTISAAFGPFTSRPTSAHIHGPAGANQNGPLLFDMGSLTTLKLGNRWYGFTSIRTFGLSLAQVQDLIAERWYIDVHTANRPNGEIRGTIEALIGFGQRAEAGSLPVANDQDRGMVSTRRREFGEMLFSLQQNWKGELDPAVVFSQSGDKTDTTLLWESVWKEYFASGETP